MRAPCHAPRRTAQWKGTIVFHINLEEFRGLTDYIMASSTRVRFARGGGAHGWLVRVKRVHGSMYPGVVRWHAPAGSVFVHLVVRLAGHDGHAVLELEVAVVGPNIFHLLAAAAAALGLGLLAGLLGVASHRRRVRVSKSGFAGRVRVACEGSERAKTRAGAGSSPELPPFADRMPDGRSKGGDFVAPLLKLPIRSLKYKCGIVGFLIINV